MTKEQAYKEIDEFVDKALKETHAVVKRKIIQLKEEKAKNKKAKNKA